MAPKRFLTDKPELDIKRIHRFLKCLYNENKKVNNQIRKRFTPFTRSLDRTMNSVHKSQDSYDENNIDHLKELHGHYAAEI